MDIEHLIDDNPPDWELYEKYGNMRGDELDSLWFSLRKSSEVIELQKEMDDAILRETTRVNNRKRFMKAIEKLTVEEPMQFCENKDLETKDTDNETKVNVKTELGVDYTHPFIYTFI